MRDREEKYRLKEERRRLKEERRVTRGGVGCGNSRVGGNIWVGLIIAFVGAGLLAREFGAFFPSWLFSWPMFLIILSLIIGAKNGFRDLGWLIIAAVGCLFLLDRMYPEIPIHRFIWPVAIIGVGLMVALGPRGRGRLWHELHDSKKEDDPQNINNPTTAGPSNTSSTGPTSFTIGGQSKNYKGGEDYIDAVAVFGGIDKMVFSKTFKGGEIVCIFGGGELNLTQADFDKVATLNITAIFGGLKLTVPPNWSVRSELNPVFGGIDDKRSQHSMPDPDKVLVLKGTVIFGGVDIRSY